MERLLRDRRQGFGRALCRRRFADPAAGCARNRRRRRHIAGGGYGTLSRQFGLTVDWLTGVRVATVDQNERPLFTHATKDNSGPLRELWWPHTGGGGGNFGLITRYEFSSLPIAPREAQISTNCLELVVDQQRGRFSQDHRGVRATQRRTSEYGVCRVGFVASSGRVRSGSRSNLPMTNRPSRCASPRRLQPC